MSGAGAVPTPILGVFYGLVQLLEEAADNGGLVRYRQPFDLPRLKKPHPKDERMRSMLDSLFYRLHLVRHRLIVTKGHVRKIGARLERSPDGREVLEFNLAALMCLPLLAPTDELREVARFFKAIQKKAEEHHTSRISVAFLSEKGKGSRYCAVNARLSPEASASAHQAFAQELQDAIQGSEVLGHFFRELSISLRRIGPYSSLVLSSESLFPEGGDPHVQYLRRAATRDA